MHRGKKGNTETYDDDDTIQCGSVSCLTSFNDGDSCQKMPLLYFIIFYSDVKIWTATFLAPKLPCSYVLTHHKVCLGTVKGFVQGHTAVCGKTKVHCYIIIWSMS